MQSAFATSAIGVASTIEKILHLGAKGYQCDEDYSFLRQNLSQKKETAAVADCDIDKFERGTSTAPSTISRLKAMTAGKTIIPLELQPGDESNRGCSRVKKSLDDPRFMLMCGLACAFLALVTTAAVLVPVLTIRKLAPQHTQTVLFVPHTLAPTRENNLEGFSPLAQP